MQNNWKDLKSSKTEVDIVSNTAVNASTTDNTAARTTNATPIIASTNKIHINYNSKNNNNNNNSNNNNNNNNNSVIIIKATTTKMKSGCVLKKNKCSYIILFASFFIR